MASVGGAMPSELCACSTPKALWHEEHPLNSLVLMMGDEHEHPLNSLVLMMGDGGLWQSCEPPTEVHEAQLCLCDVVLFPWDASCTQQARVKPMVPK